MRAILRVLGAGLAVTVCGASGAFAQDAPPADEVEIEPAALAAVRQMGEFLRSLDDVEFTAKITRDEVLDSGQTIQQQQVLTAYVRPPTGLRIDATSAERERQFYYDGKTLTVFGPRTMYYASIDTPPTIREMIDDIAEKYDLEMPLSDLFFWGTEDEDETAITSAFRVGVDQFGNRLCDSYAFRQEDVDWQVWIERGTEPLPCKLVVTDLSDEARPQYSAELDWMIDPTFGDVVFEFTPPKDAQRIEMMTAEQAAKAAEAAEAADTGETEN
jgi:hypothetical protein